jgi:DNA-binding transcriptional LysR family regulator
MVDLIAAQAEPRLHLRRRHEADMAEGLKLMAVNGHGVAFLPASAVRRELLSGELVHAGPAWGLAMEVRLYRERPTEARPGKPAVNALWRRVAADLAVDGTPVP